VRCFVGVDVGTSSLRVTALTEDGLRLGVTARRYLIDHPHGGWAEQDPEVWWRAACQALHELLGDEKLAGHDVVAVGLSGQMHGLVLVDAAGQPVRPAIIWPDRRSTAQVAAWCARAGRSRLHATTGLPPVAGMFGPSLAWVSENEPPSLLRAAAAVLPKDFIRLRLTGAVATDPTDASGTMLFDVTARRWAEDLLELAAAPRELLPEVRPTQSVAGAVTREASAATGLPVGTRVVVGGGDQSMSAITLGLERAGRAAVAISSGGTALVLLDKPVVVPDRGLHTLCHGPATWLGMGAMLTAGLSLSWLVRSVLTLVGDPPGNLGPLIAEAGRVPAGADGLVFLPYLAGERTPHVDPRARGAFLGLSLSHDRRHLVRAILEGVAFGLKDCLGVVAETGVVPAEVIASGGGGRSPVWRQVLADVLGLPVLVASHDEHSVLGAALTAARGVGVDLPPPTETGMAVDPQTRHRALYEERYTLFRQAYTATREVTHALAGADAAGSMAD
jgi:xylulokinase